MSKPSLKWQPVVLIIENGKRVECECGALAVFVSGRIGSNYNELDSVDCWCQDCWTKAVGAQEEQEHDAN